MQCFDHGEPFVGLCGWCGKQVCQRCIARQEGRKKYCRGCAGKMVQFKPAERIEDRVKSHSEAKVAPTPPEEPHIEVDNSSHVKRTVVTGHRRPIDPRHFELDDDFVERTAPEPIPDEHPAQMPAERPAPRRPAFDPFPNATRGVHIPGPSAPRESSRSSAPPIHSAAQSAMGFFAASAMETKRVASTATSPRPPSPPSPTPRPAHHPPQSPASAHASSRPASQPVHAAAQNAMSFFAQSAMETKRMSSPQADQNHATAPQHASPSRPAEQHATGQPSVSSASPSGAAQKAMGFFAQSAMETKRASSAPHPPSTHSPAPPSPQQFSPSPPSSHSPLAHPPASSFPSPSHSSPQSHSLSPPDFSPSPQSQPPAHSSHSAPASKPTSDPAGAAQKAFGFLAMSAKETQKKGSGN